MIIIGQDKDIIVNFDRCNFIFGTANEVNAMIERSRMGDRNIQNRKKEQKKYYKK